jgi:hypothetical protein
VGAPVDLPAFRLIEPDTSVYLYYAGRDRKYMALSRLERRIFLDLPGFLVSRDTFRDENQIIQALNRADEVGRFLRDPSNRPRPRSLNEYAPTIPFLESGIDRSFVADLANVKAMFVEMKVGDVIVMTPHNHYDPLLIGEVANEWSEEQIMFLPNTGENSVPYREVHWLQHGLSRRDFPADVARRLQNRKAITKVDPDYYEPIFKRIYHAYVWGDTSKLDVFAPLYNSNDPTATAESSFIIKYAIAFYGAYQKGEIEQFNELELEQAAERYFDPTLVAQVAQAFGSPGGYLAKLLGTGGAVAVAIILATALSDESQPLPQVQQTVSDQAEELGAQTSPQRANEMKELGSSLRAGRADELRTRYGRGAKAKLGLSLHGDTPPDAVPDRITP